MCRGPAILATIACTVHDEKYCGTTSCVAPGQGSREPGSCESCLQLHVDGIGDGLGQKIRNTDYWLTAFSHFSTTNLSRRPTEPTLASAPAGPPAQCDKMRLLCLASFPFVRPFSELLNRRG